MRRGRDKSLTRAKGFTLMEIMVAVAVVATVFVAAYKLFSQAVTAEGFARFYTVAPMLAQQKMAEISSGVMAADKDGSGSFENFPGYGWRVTLTDVSSETLKNAVTELKLVSVTISAADNARSFSLRSYVFLRK